MTMTCCISVCISVSVKCMYIHYKCMLYRLVYIYMCTYDICILIYIYIYIYLYIHIYIHIYIHV